MFLVFFVDSFPAARSAVPQFMQNLALSGLVVWQFGQIILEIKAQPLRTVEQLASSRRPVRPSR
jgi:hypothetical protein